MSSLLQDLELVSWVTSSGLPLKVSQVDFQRPFSLCGVDYAGPLLVQVRAGGKKVWIALFVCGTTRAVHLEVVESLSVDDFILAWHRFVSRRSTLRQVRSDNGTTFVAAAKVLCIRWIFNPPAAPWFGGFYERLVRVVKTPLKKVLGKALLRPAELVTVHQTIRFKRNFKNTPKSGFRQKSNF